MKKHNLREKSRILVEHILDKNFLEANGVLEQLISEAEEDRENSVAEEFGFDDAPEGGDVTPTDGGDDVQLDGAPEGLSDSEANKVVDDTVEIACQINAKIVAKLFDKVSALKQTLDNAGLDQDSRDFIKFDTSITYYSDKLQDLQGKTNPGVDQSKVEEALNKIDTSLEQLKGEIGGRSAEDTTDIASPEEISSTTEETEENNTEQSESTGETSEEPENTEENSEEGAEDDNFDDLFA